VTQYDVFTVLAFHLLSLVEFLFFGLNLCRKVWCASLP